MPINGYEKAAIFLSAVGENVASEILKSLDPEDIGKISSYMRKSKKNDKNIVQSIFQETLDTVTSGDTQMGGEEYVNNILRKGLGDGADKIIEMVSKESAMESLKWVNPTTLTSFLIAEHPQTIAMIICLLEPEQASAVMQALPDHIMGDVAMRVATTERISELAMKEIEEVLRVQLDIGKTKDGKTFKGNMVLAEILNQCDRSTETSILESIESQNDKLADSIRELMLTFDDLEEIDDRGIQLILKELSTDDLALALKTASEGLKEKIFRSMSQRAVLLLKEEMETRGPVKVSEVEAAQQNIVKVARRLDEEGKIVMPGRGGEELV
ncbi:MAG: flagellar motor switch protein FliG [Nitrospira sp.]|nr:flagellar motor switch protein FliG [Nitrospira sp.]